MTFVGERPSTAPGAAPEPTDLDLLFKEAKRRERRRRLAAVGIVLIFFGAVATIVLALTSQTQPSPHPAKVSTPYRPSSTGLPSGAIVSLKRAGALAVGPTGALYVFDETRHEVLVRLPDGLFRVVAGDGKSGYSGDGGPATKASLYDVSDMAFAPNGDLYLADSGPENVIEPGGALLAAGVRVRVVDRNGEIHTIAGNGKVDRPVANDTPALSAPLGPYISIAFSPSGQLYIATASQLFRITASNDLESVPAVISPAQAVETPGRQIIVASQGHLNSFGSIAVDAQGNVYASSTYAGWSVFRISPNGVATELGYARRSGGNTAIIQRGTGGVIDVDDGPYILRVVGNSLVTSSATDEVSGISRFDYLDYFALAPNGTVYADDIGEAAFGPYQQVVTITGGHGASLWRGPSSK